MRVEWVINEWENTFSLSIFFGVKTQLIVEQKHMRGMEGVRPTACGYVLLCFQYARKAL